MKERTRIKRKERERKKERIVERKNISLKNNSVRDRFPQGFITLFGKLFSCSNLRQEEKYYCE